MANTANATVNTFNANLGYYLAGTVVKLSTTENLGVTLLRLYDYTTGEHLAVSAAQSDGKATISYRVPFDRYLRLAAGCATQSCSGLIVVAPGYGRYWSSPDPGHRWSFELGAFNSGITVQAGTHFDLQLTQASCFADPGVTTHLVLKDATTGELLAQSAGFQGTICSKIIYTLPFRRQLRLEADCAGAGSCSGVLDVAWKFDSMGSLRTDPETLLWRKPHNQSFLVQGVDLRFGANNQFPEVYSDLKHFQGFNRLRVGTRGERSNLAMVSGSATADLHVAEMRSKNWRDPSPWGWGFNLDTDKSYYHYQLADTTMQILNITHAGGFQQSGRYLFIGIESLTDSSASTIHVFDMSYNVSLVFEPPPPFQLRELYVIDRPSGQGARSGSAGAIGVTRLPNQKYLMSVVQYSGDFIDFYIKDAGSTTSGYADIGENSAAPWRFLAEIAEGGPDIIKPPRANIHYDNANLFTTTDGRIWFIGTLRSANIDVAEVYEVLLNEADPAHPIKLQNRGWRWFDCKRKDGGAECQFDGAAGIYINPDADQLLVYSSEYFESRGQVNFTEF